MTVNFSAFEASGMESRARIVLDGSAPANEKESSSSSSFRTLRNPLSLTGSTGMLKSRIRAALPPRSRTARTPFTEGESVWNRNSPVPILPPLRVFRPSRIAAT